MGSDEAFPRTRIDEHTARHLERVAAWRALESLGCQLAIAAALTRAFRLGVDRGRDWPGIAQWTPGCRGRQAP
jgi:hypothetical protein